MLPAADFQNWTEDSKRNPSRDFFSWLVLRNPVVVMFPPIIHPMLGPLTSKERQALAILILLLTLSLLGYLVWG